MLPSESGQLFWTLSQQSPSPLLFPLPVSTALTFWGTCCLSACLFLLDCQIPKAKDPSLLANYSSRTMLAHSVTEHILNNWIDHFFTLYIFRKKETKVKSLGKVIGYIF